MKSCEMVNVYTWVLSKANAGFGEASSVNPVSSKKAILETIRNIERFEHRKE